MDFDHDARMSAFFRPKDIVSILNLVFGFASIVLAYHGLSLHAAAALVAAAIADAMDGFVARRFSTPTEFGEAIDIADLVSFGAAPGFFIIVWIGTPFSYIAGFAVVTAALLRLSRFQVREGHDTGWVGVPVTVNGVLYPLLFVLDAPHSAVVTIALLFSYLNISSLHVPKP